MAKRARSKKDNLPVNPEESDFSSDKSTDDADECDSSELDENDDSDSLNSKWTQNVGNFVVDWDFFDSPSTINILSIPKKNVESFLFSQIFTTSLLDSVVTETNKYAFQKKSKNWHDTNNEEVSALLGMWILMGIHKLPRVRNYWSSDPFLKVDCVANIMPYTRFSKLTEMIHFNDNDSMLPRTDPNYDKLHKIRPLIDHVNQTSNKSYNTSKTVSVDESMIPFSGRSSFIQYMPMKPIKRGFKVWCLADSSTGYVVKSEVYTGKARDGSKNPLGERVVLILVSNILGVGYFVAFDNFFTSVNLVEELLDKGIYSVGTVRNNRKGLPEMLKAKEKMKRGDFNYRIKKSISAIKWMDRKPVSVLTSAYVILRKLSRSLGN